MVSSQFRSRMRAGVAAAASVAVVTMSMLAAPVASADSTSDAQSSLIGDGTFSSGLGAWIGYGGSALDASSGAACTTLGDGAAGSLYNAGVVYNGVAITEGQSYTLAFRASASVDGTQIRALVGQNGNPYGTVFDKGDLTLGTDISADGGYYSYTFTADKTFPASGAGNDSGDPQGQLAFQLGGHPGGWTFCLDDVSLTSDTEVLPNTTFDGTLPAGWTLPEDYAVTSVEGDDALCFDVPHNTGQYTGLNFNGVPLEQGSQYRLSFTATASAPNSTVRSLVGEGKSPYATFKDSIDNFSSEPKTVTFDFTAPETLPTEGDAQVGQVALQTGAGASDHGFTFCVSSISLLKLAQGPQPYAPDTGSPVRVNQVGYLPNGPKEATLVSDADAGQAWQLLSADDEVVASGTATPEGVDASAGVKVQVIDFSSYTTPGQGYRVKVGDDVSDPFTIGADIYQSLAADALDYFYKVRSGIAVDPAIVGDGYGRAAGHVSSADPSKNPEGTKNKGDLDVPCLTSAQDGSSWSYGTWTCPSGYTRDVVGGWYDAGDHGKYVVNGGIAVSQLMSAYERSQQAPTSNDALGDSTLKIPAAESGDGVPDVLNEVKWELDFLLSMQVPLGTGMKYDGKLLDGMVHHKVHDVGWTGLPLDPAADPQERALARPSTAATLNLAAVAAQGARIFANYQDQFPGYEQKLLNASKVAYDAATRVPDLYAPASAGNNGGGPYDDTKVGDERYWATAELYLTTKSPKYGKALAGNAYNTDQSIWTPSGFDWGHVAALGVIDLATVPNSLPERPQIQASLLAGADKYLAWQQASPFGTSYPGVPRAGGGVDYEWGSTSMVGNNDAVLATAFDLTGATKYRDAVLESMDYLLGRNALNTSFVTGYGTTYAVHQHSRWLESTITGETPPGSLSGGPNSQSGTWDPTIAALYNPSTHPCAPQLCYVDDRQAWSVNEVAINWNASLAWVAAFVADQDGGSKPPAGGLPVVTTQPHDASAVTGTKVTFAVAATGTPTPTIQWQTKAHGSSTWSDVAGATSASLQVTTTIALDGAQYRAVASNVYGTATSSAATLHVAAAPAAPIVTKQPVSVTVALGASTTLTAAASGVPTPTVAWQSRKPGTNTWSAVKGATSTSLKVTATAASDGTSYRAVFTNVKGTATTSAVTVTVKHVAPKFTTQPKAAKAAAGKKATFTVKATGYPAPKVQWQSKAKGSSMWKSIKGATSTKLVVTVKGSLDGASYRAVATNAAGKATSATAKLTVTKAKPRVTAQPRSVTVKAGTRTTFTVSVSAYPTAHVQWYSQKGHGHWVKVKGATRTTLTVKASSSVSGTHYRAVVSNSKGTVTSKSATLTVRKK